MVISFQPDIIRGLGYTVEEHKVKTADGHILTMFRIPNHHTSNELTNRHPVYLQHGLVATCANFLGLGRNSLGIVYFIISNILLIVLCEYLTYLCRK